MKRPTIADIAREAGVSKAAVSHALNGQRGVSTATRERVLAVAGRLNFPRRQQRPRPRRRQGAGRRHGPATHAPSSPLLFPVLVGGGGPLRRVDIRYWIWSLPPSGPLTFVCEWPAQVITETRTTIDSDPILDAARRSFELWSEEPDSPDELHHRLAS